MAILKNCTAAQLSLAWLLQKAKDLHVNILPIPGTTKLANARDNIASVSIYVSPEEMATLEALGKYVGGTRGNQQYIAATIESQNL